ncbi:MAG: tetratricopeptide repeat protein [Chloroflexota bacterium]
MIRLPQFVPHLDERLAAEFLAHSLTLLPVPLRQDTAIVSESVLRFERPEPPRDPDLPLLPTKVYPRPEASLMEATVRAMVPPPPIAGFVGRKTELDQAVLSLLSGRPAVLVGESGTGKTALLRQIAADTRIRKAFKRVWWLDDLEEAGAALGLALNAPSVLRADFKDQPRLAREFLIPNGVLLLVDVVSLEEIPRALAFSSTVAIGTREWTGQATRIVLGGLNAEFGTELLVRLSGQSEAAARPLAALVDYRPRALGLMATLMSEDGLPPQAVNDLLVSGGPDRLAVLYSASFEALPEDYRALCSAFAASPKDWIAIESVVAQYEKPIVGQRALTFLERRGFIERTESAVRVVGNWHRAIPPAAAGFPAIVRPAKRFVARTEGEGSTQGAALHAQGLALMESGSNTEAEAALNEALTLRLAGDTDHAVAETLTALGRLAYLQGDDTAAIRHLERAAERLHILKDEESLEIIRLALSRAYRRAGRLDAALAVLGDDSSPEDLAAVYRAREEWPQAIKVYERWLQTDESAVYGLAETYILAGRYPEANDLLNGNAAFEAQWLRALMAHLQGDIAKALDIYTRIRLDVPPPQRAAFSRAFGRALAAMGEVHDAALIVSAEGVWYEATLPRPIFARQKASQALAAHFNLMLGRWDEAEIAARHAREITGERPDPLSDAMIQCVLGHVMWSRGDLDRAVVAFEAELKARNAIPHRDENTIGVVLHNLADIQRERGEFDRAIANYRRALTHKDPTRNYRSVMLTRLALCELLVQVGRSADALEAGQQAVELLTRRNDVDLQLAGYIMALQTQALREAGRDQRAVQLWDTWLARLAQRVNEGLAHPFWGVQALALGLYLRSLPESITAETVVPVTTAEEMLQTVEANASDTWIAGAARRDLGNVYLRLEQWGDAYSTLKPLLASIENANDETDVPITLRLAHLSAARAAAKLGRLDEAIQHFDAARDAESDRHTRGLIARETGDLYRTAGKESYAAERYVQALELLNRDLAPALYIDTWVSLAYARLRLRRFGDAIDTFEQALGIIKGMPTQDSVLLSSVLYDMATAHYTLGQYKRAAATYKQALSQLDARREPERYVATLTALAQSNVELEAYKDALEAYHDALQFDVLNTVQRRTILTQQAEIFIHIGLTQAAIDAYRSALALEGGDAVERAALQRGLGTLYAQLNMNTEASSHFEAALAAAVQDEQTGLTLRALGDVYRAQNQLPQAIEAYRRAIEGLDRATHPVELAATQRALGEIYLGFGQAFEALTQLEAALELEKALPQQDGGRIVSTLQGLAQVHELRGELELATRRHHEALVYQDKRYTPEGYVGTLRELGRLYALQTRYSPAAKAYEEALGTEANQPSPDEEKVNTMTEALADVYRAQGRLEAAAKLYKQVMKVLQAAPRSTSSRFVTPKPAESPLRDRVSHSLQTTEADIARHIQTLNAADQSWTLLNRMANPDLKQLVFVRALQAQTSAALGRATESNQYLDQLMVLLTQRRDEVSPDDPQVVVRAFALLLQAQEAENASDLNVAQQTYSVALDTVQQDAKPDSALVWVIEQKAARINKKGTGPLL